jgi:hypothetical protein
VAKEITHSVPVCFAVEHVSKDLLFYLQHTAFSEGSCVWPLMLNMNGGQPLAHKWLCTPQSPVHGAHKDYGRWELVPKGYGGGGCDGKGGSSC